MMATVPHVISGLGLRKFQAVGFLLTRVYIHTYIHTYTHSYKPTYLPTHKHTNIHTYILPLNCATKHSHFFLFSSMPADYAPKPPVRKCLGVQKQ